MDKIKGDEEDAKVKTKNTNPYIKNLNGRLARAIKKNGIGDTDPVETVYRYNSKGEIVKVYESGREVEYSYNPDGSVESIRYPDEESTVVSYGYDPMGRLNKIEGEGETYTSDYTYDYEGRLLYFKKGGIDTSYSYDFQGKIIEIDYTKDGSSIFNEKLSYQKIFRDTSEDFESKLYAKGLNLHMDEAEIILSPDQETVFVFENIGGDEYKIKKKDNDNSYWRVQERRDFADIVADANENTATIFIKKEQEGGSFHLEVKGTGYQVDEEDSKIIASGGVTGILISKNKNYDGIRFQLQSQLNNINLIFSRPEGLAYDILINDLGSQPLFELEFNYSNGSYKIKHADTGYYLFETWDSSLGEYLFTLDETSSTDFNIYTLFSQGTAYDEFITPRNTNRIMTVDEKQIGIHPHMPAMGRTEEDNNLQLKHMYHLIAEEGGRRLDFDYSAWPPSHRDSLKEEEKVQSSEESRSKTMVEGYQHGYITEVTYSGEEYNNGDEINIKYEYDHLGRLTASERTVLGETTKNEYHYDRNGNILSKDGNLYEYEEGSNRLLEIKDGDGASINQLEYDELGAVISMNRSDGRGMTFERCPLTNKITRADIEGIGSFEYRYNGNGDRIEKKKIKNYYIRPMDISGYVSPGEDGIYKISSADPDYELVEKAPGSYMVKNRESGKYWKVNGDKIYDQGVGSGEDFVIEDNPSEGSTIKYSDRYLVYDASGDLTLKASYGDDESLNYFIEAVSDLDITLDVNSTEFEIVYDSVVEYTISIQNNSLNRAQNIRVKDTLGQISDSAGNKIFSSIGFQLINAQEVWGGISLEESELVVEIDGEATAEIIITGTIKAAGEDIILEKGEKYENTVSLLDSDITPIEIEFTVGDLELDLDLELDVNPQSFTIEYESEVTYCISIANNSPHETPNIRVEDLLGEISDSLGNKIFSSIICNIENATHISGEISLEESELVVKIDGGVTAEITVTGSIKSAGEDITLEEGEKYGNTVSVLDSDITPIEIEFTVGNLGGGVEPNKKYRIKFAGNDQYLTRITSSGIYTYAATAATSEEGDIFQIEEGDEETVIKNISYEGYMAYHDFNRTMMHSWGPDPVVLTDVGDNKFTIQLEKNGRYAQPDLSDRCVLYMEESATGQVDQQFIFEAVE